MKYLGFALLVCAACVALAGCKRGGSGERRVPVDLQGGGDIVQGPRDKNVTFAARSPEQRKPIWITSVRDLDERLKKSKDDPAGQKKIIQDILKNQDEAEKDQKAAQYVGEQKKLRQKERVEDDFREFARFCYLYLKTNVMTPNRDYSRKLFLLYARETQAIVKHKYLDSTTSQIAIDPISINSFIEDGKMAFVPYVNLSFPNYVVAYEEAPAENKLHRVWYSNDTAGFVAPAEVAALAEYQEFRLLYELRIMYLDGLRRDEQPAFAKYLEQVHTRMPAQLLRDLKEKIIALNPSVNLADKNQILACRTSPDADASRGYRAVYCSGTIQFLQKAQLPFMPKVEKKDAPAKKGGGGIGGMPNMPMP